MMDEIKRDLLVAHLECTIPFWLINLRERGLEPGSLRFQKELDECKQAVSCEGDTILYKTDNTAKNVNLLSKGIAMLIMACGEVEAFGRVFKE
jgi:hypothetical protein